MKMCPDPGFVANAAGRPFARSGPLSHVQGVDPLPRLPLQGPFRVLEVNGRRLRVRANPEGPRVEDLAVLGPDLEAVAGKRQPMPDNVSGCFAVALGLRGSPGPLQVLRG